MKVLVTGGCGFIGSHLVDRLVNDGYRVKVYDLLEPQVHHGKEPEYLNKNAEYIFADIRDKDSLKKAIRGVEVIFHLASQVGVGQSMYQIEKYTSHNLIGTAVLLDVLVNTKNKVKKLIVASSMSIYGEGTYKCKNCGVVYPQERDQKQLKKKDWELYCPNCNKKIKPIPTAEDKPLYPSSIYASNKRVQEEMCLIVGKAYKIPTVALRYFNVYGPRQSLSNPYTGVAAIFLSRVKNNKPPLVFEDGKQSRDFIYIDDLITANILAMKNSQADYEIFNVGSGKPTRIIEIAYTIISLLGSDVGVKVLNRYRIGDIRHCYADISKIRNVLGFEPRIKFGEGMRRLISWAESEKAIDLTDKAYRELERHHLTT